MYDFLQDKKGYIERCMPYINEMNKDFLYDLLHLKYNNMDNFISKYDTKLKRYDVGHVARCKKLIRQLYKGQKIPCTDESVYMMATLMSKRYILKPKTSDLHVSCNIYVDYGGQMRQLRINRYNIKINNEYKYTYMSGYVENNETIENALLREAKEELGFKFPLDRYTLVSINECSYFYDIYLSQDEYESYCNNIDIGVLDPEITRIILC